MKEERDLIKVRLKTVNEALKELQTLSFAYDSRSSNRYDFEKEWSAILDKYDINYNNLNRWFEV